MLQSIFGRTVLGVAVVSAMLATSALAQQRTHKPSRASHTTESARDRPGYFVINRATSLYSAPSADARVVRKLSPGMVVHVIHVRDQWYDVKSEHGNQDGYIRRSFADPESERRAGSDSGRRAGSDSGSGERLRFRKGTFRLVDPVVVRAEPNIDSRQVMTLREGAEVRVVDKQGNWYRIESESGNKPPGYIPTVSAKRVEGAR